MGLHLEATGKVMRLLTKHSKYLLLIMMDMDTDARARIPVLNLLWRISASRLHTRVRDRIRVEWTTVT